MATASVACGVLGVGGNKGAVAVEFSLFRHKVALLCSHFAAHQGAVEARNANYQAIVKALTFTRRAWLADEDVDEALAAPGGAGLGDGGEPGDPVGRRIRSMKTDAGTVVCPFYDPLPSLSALTHSLPSHLPRPR